MQIHSRFALLCLWFIGGIARADDASVGRRDYQIASTDPGIQISVREVMPPGASTFGEDRVVVFVHGHGIALRCWLGPWLLALGLGPELNDYGTSGESHGAEEGKEETHGHNAGEVCRA